MPRYLEPMKATLATKPFRDEDWLFEIKWDGYRVEAVVRDGKVELFTRNGNDAETYFPRLLTPPSWIEAREAIVDGEVVALDEDGRPGLQPAPGADQRRADGAGGAARLPGVRPAVPRRPLAARRARSSSASGCSELVLRPTARVRYATHIDTEGVAFFEAAKAQALEGIVAKQRRSRYELGRRSSAWLKIKVRPEQELVVGGWTPGEGNAEGARCGRRRRVRGRPAALRRQGGLRVHGADADGAARGARGARDGRSRRSTRPRPPTTGALGRRPRAASAGSRPELVIRAEIGGWTRDGHVRQTAFKGLEAGRDPREVVRERAIDPGEGGSRGRRGVPDGADAGRGRHAGRRHRSAGDDARDIAAARRIPSWLVTPAELDALAALKGEGTWQVGGPGPQAHEPRQGPVPAPRRASTKTPVTKRELDRATSPGSRRRCCPTSPTGRSTSSASRTARARPGFWQKDIPTTAPRWLTLWHETGFREREDRAPNDHLVADRAATLCWLGNQAAFEIHAWTSTLHDPWPPTFALIDIDPGPKTTWDETVLLARLYRTALEHLGVRAYPKMTGSRGIQAWIPIERGRYTLRRHERLGRDAVAGGRRDRPGPRVVGVGEGRARRQGAPRLHAERGDQDARRAVRGPAPAGRAGLRADPLGRARRPGPRQRPLDDPQRRRPGRRASATCSRRPRRTTRCCRRCRQSGRPARQRCGWSAGVEITVSAVAPAPGVPGGMPSMHRRTSALAIATALLLVFVVAPGAGSAPAKPALPADFNGDGFQDLAVGAAWLEPFRMGADQKGLVTVLYGSATGLTAAGNQAWSLDSPGVKGVAPRQAGYGEALASGDFDGDGYADLAVGCRGGDREWNRPTRPRERPLRQRRRADGRSRRSCSPETRSSATAIPGWASHG